MTCRIFSVLAAVAALAVPQAVSAAETVTSTAGDRTELSVVVYNRNTAMVRESRAVDLPGGESELRLAGLGRMLLPSSVAPELGDGVRLVQQRYHYNLLNRDKLLAAHVGREVLVERENERTGVTERIPARLLAVDGGPVLEIDGRVALEPGGRVLLPGVPEDLVTEPVLSWLVDVRRGGEREIELSYLTNGLSWQAEYVLSLAGESEAELSAWVGIRNDCGTDFRGADVHLIAGQLNQAARPEMANVQQMRMSLAAAPEGRGDAGPVPREQFEYYRYDLGRTVDLPHSQLVQVELFPPRELEVEKIYRVSGSSRIYHGRRGGDVEPEPAEVILAWTAGKEADEPLPSGLVRVYQREADGAAWFAGEDRIGHTPAGERMTISAGRAFDVRAERVQTDFQRPSDRLRRVTVQIELINGKDRPVTVQVDEPLPGDWTITGNTHDFEKLDSQRVRFAPRVPAGGRVTVRYTVEFI